MVAVALVTGDNVPFFLFQISTIIGSIWLVVPLSNYFCLHPDRLYSHNTPLLTHALGFENCHLLTRDLRVQKQTTELSWNRVTRKQLLLWNQNVCILSPCLYFPPQKLLLFKICTQVTHSRKLSALALPLSPGKGLSCSPQTVHLYTALVVLLSRVVRILFSPSLRVQSLSWGTVWVATNCQRICSMW